MMKCQQTIELLPWFVNNSLETDEAAAVRSHLESCQTCRDELQETGAAFEAFSAHAEPERLLAIGFDSGEATEWERTHLSNCASCSEELAMVRESRDSMSEAAPVVSAPNVPNVPNVPNAPNAPNVVPLRREPTWSRFARAAAVVVTLVAGGWIWSTLQTGEPTTTIAEVPSPVSDPSPLAGEIVRLEDENRALRESRATLQEDLEAMTRESESLAGRLGRASRPRLNVSIVDVYPKSFALRNGDQAEASASVPGDAQSVTLILNSQLEPPGPLACRLLSPSGETVWTIKGLEPSPEGGFTLSFSAAALEPGDYGLVLFDEAGMELESYGLSVR